MQPTLNQKSLVILITILFVVVLLSFQNCGQSGSGSLMIGNSSSTSGGIEDGTLHIYFSGSGAIPGLNCVQVTAPNDPDWGLQNYICSDLNVGLQWSTSGAISGLTCVNFANPNEPSTHNWANNYLCFTDTTVDPQFSISGQIYGDRCSSLASSDPSGWYYAYLCYLPTTQ